MPEQKNFVVTGAARGTGAAAVQQLVARGNSVLAVDRDGEELRRMIEKLGGDFPGRAEAAEADVSVAADVERCVARVVDSWGGLDGIFNIAAILGEFGDLAVGTEGNYDRVMAVNAKSVWLGMKYAIPALLARGGGAIVNTGSHLAWHGGEKLAAYTAAKHAVVGLTKTVALEYAKRNIRANVVSPASMDTKMGADTEAGYDPGDPAAAHRRFVEASPDGRLGKPEETAAVGVWLLLDAPAHVNGVMIPVDGARAAC